MRIQNGWLVLADLSGFTSFMAATELDHAQGILGNLLGLLRRKLTPTLHLAEVEGDAVFLYAPGHRLKRGETLLELIEHTYVAFRDKQRSMVRTATCPCRACREIPALDLKFVSHCGEYALHELTGTPKPMGSCVNLAHRLLKNGVADETGWRGYALFTQEALERLGIQPDGAHVRTEVYEHFGELPLTAIDLDARYRELTAQRRVALTAADAHVTISHRFAAAPPLIWEWLNDPGMREQWLPRSAWHAGHRPTGRTGIGSYNHCSKFNFVEEVLDWRPFDYFTVRFVRPPLTVLITGELNAGESGGTELHYRLRMEGSAPRLVRAGACRLFAERMMKLRDGFTTIEKLSQV
jgi:hypothetical protein